MDVVADAFHTKHAVTNDMTPATSFSSLEKEEKRDDSSSPILDDEVEQDLDLPTTQLLMQELADEALQENETEALPKSPVVMHSPSKVHVTPTRSCKSPVKARASPIKTSASPIKVKSPMKLRSPSMEASKPIAASPPIVSTLVQAEEAVEETIPEEFRAEGSEGKFTKVFPAVSKLVESRGWQIATGHNTMFCAMPGVQFFNFKPNINVFDSKRKACWKFIQMAGETKKDTEDQELWDMLWPVAEKDFGWLTMMCGSETWYVEPNTKFEQFQPNKTIFQTKKRAVLKCLSVEVGEIELGDSIEGHQVIAFAPREKQPAPASAVRKAKTSLFKTPSPAVSSMNKRTTPGSNSSSRFVTPANRPSPSVHSTSAKHNPSSSGSKVSTSALKKTKKPSSTLSAKKPTIETEEKTVPQTPASVTTNKGNGFHFTPPEFRCTFGIVYAKLQEEGWYHRSGTFEYDYFSPSYTKATKELKVNYFQSQADLEEYLKESGTWERVENELRLEHDKAVEEEREKALERHYERLKKRRRNVARSGAQPGVLKPKNSPKKTASKKIAREPQSLYQAEVEAARTAEAEDARLSKMPKLKFGSVLQKLLKRGWYYRPGRFEYDYFKPGTNPKSAVAGEERFESASDLEVYLKTTGLWEEIADELAQDERVQHDHQSTEKRPLKRSKHASSALVSSSPPEKASNGGVQKDDVNAITNDIWANSHEFDFNE
ncbi:hypothetical protein PsorP6_006369 [Peronosclerospora sorghi]|uniref:Uncharacterized protein n=1 Tax=Peronosclerospora sorghi TaxID=230839 RepID=A0ACC0W813_9STRA|nr:hypothetical protein PsorP6_006369 [Peronosclerospora sorghi]